MCSCVPPRVIPVGLHYEDLLRESPALELALQRLPKAQVNDRHRRTILAMDLSAKHAHLPQEQWTTVEQDAVVRLSAAAGFNGTY